MNKPVNREITIPVLEYYQLIDDQYFLQCLRNAGVDNWIGYGDAVAAFEDGKE